MTRDEKIFGGALLGLFAVVVGGAFVVEADKAHTGKATTYGSWIQAIVRTLDGSVHGKQWPAVALDELEKVVAGWLPPPFGFLLNIVYQVERDSLLRTILKKDKLSHAVSRALARR